MRRAFLFAACLGCASTPPRAPAGKVDVVPPAASESAVLSPVRAPEDLLLVGRLRDVRPWLKLEGLPPALSQLTKDALEGDGFLEILNLAEPFEMAAVWQSRTPGEADVEPDCDEYALDCEPSAEASPEILAAISIPLRSWEPARLERLGFVASGRDRFVDETCAASRSLGGAPARIVCGDTLGALRRLEGYMTRGLPLEPLSPSPLFLELRPEPLRRAWQAEREEFEHNLHALPGAFDAPGLGPSGAMLGLLRAGQVLLTEANAWIDSTRNVSLEARPSADDGVEIVLSVTTNEPHPWLMRAQESAGQSASAAPDMFRRLSARAARATFARGLLQSDTRVLLDGALDLSNALGSYTSSATARRDELAVLTLDGIKRLLESQCLSASESAAASFPYRKATSGAALDERARTWLGHQVFGTPKSAECGEWLRSTLDSMVRSKPARHLLSQFKRGVALRNVRAPRALGAQASAYELYIPQQALADEALYELVSTGNAEPVEQARTPLRLTLVIMPDRDVEWFGLSAAPEELYALLARVREAKPESFAAGLSRLERPHTLWGSFATLRESVSELKTTAPAIGATLGPLLSEATLDAPLVSTLRVFRAPQLPKTVRAELELYLPPALMADARRVAMSDSAQFEALARAVDAALGESDPEEVSEEEEIVE